MWTLAPFLYVPWVVQYMLIDVLSGVSTQETFECTPPSLFNFLHFDAVFG